jgi:hypothetical protein
MNEFELNQYDKIFISEFKGVKSLDLGYTGKNGENYPRKIKREFGRDNWKDAYFKIQFKDDAQFAEFVAWLNARLEALTGAVDGDDIPF